jgi:diacylglycerol kinase family enzyme
MTIQQLHTKTPDVVLIFNPSAGDANASTEQLQLIRATLRDLGLRTQLRRVRPRSNITHLAAGAAARGVPYVCVCGGDNTVDMAARGLVGTDSKLVVLPGGTRNNIALALNIPSALDAATRLIQSGKPVGVDVGQAQTADGRTIPFVELVSVGLAAALFPSLDEAQKGDLTRLGDLLGTFISHPPATFQLDLDGGRQRIEVQALMLLALNMPYLGANFQLGSTVDHRDGLLDVFLYADLGKLDLLTHAVQVARGITDDERVRHLRVKSFSVTCDPPLPVMVDGQVLNSRVLRSGELVVRTTPGQLKVMVP